MADRTQAPRAPAGRHPVVAVQQLTKVFKDFWMRDRARAVDGVSFHIDRGEIFGLLGPNGSGKSTTIKLLLGLLRPTRGRIAVFGKSPNDVEIKKRIGYLPEESYLYGFLNARETLDYYGKLFGLDPKTRERRIDELLDMVGLIHAQHRSVREFSKGMQRRIGIAQALINDPELLILDEPTTGLDPIGTRQVKDLIIELGRRGKTVLLSSHLLADVEDVVDRMVILYGGKIRREGGTEELLTRRDHTIRIETDELDDDTIAEIDRLIRERSGGAKALRGVARPRQKLEELFLGIVAEAKQERLATSGATNEGGTAGFLRADTPDEGSDPDALIAGLVESRDASADLSREPAGMSPMPVDDGDDERERAEEVIGELLGERDAEDRAAHDDEAPADRASPGADTHPDAPSPEEVDLGVIGSLVDRADDERREDDRA